MSKAIDKTSISLLHLNPIGANLPSVSAPVVGDNSEKERAMSRREIVNQASAAMCAVVTMNVAPSEAIAAQRADDLRDPIFAAIERHRRAWDVGNQVSDDEDTMSAWSDQENAAFASLAATTPTTAAGIAALAAYIVEKDDDTIYDDRYGRLAGAIRRGALFLDPTN